MFFPFFPMVSTPQVWHENATVLSGREIWFSSLTVWITSVCYFNLLVLPITYRNWIFLPKGAEIFPNPFPHCAYIPKEKRKTGFVARFGGRERFPSVFLLQLLGDVSHLSARSIIHIKRQVSLIPNIMGRNSNCIIQLSTSVAPQRDHSAPAGEFALPHARWTAEKNSNWATRM